MAKIGSQFLAKTTKQFLTGTNSKRSLKNVVKLDPYYSSWAVKRAVARFVEDYNHRRYHESLQNVTPADMYHGRQAAILARRARIKQRTLQRRKRENLQTPHHAVIRSEVSLSKSPERSHFVSHRAEGVCTHISGLNTLTQLSNESGAVHPWQNVRHLCDHFQATSATRSS